MFVRVTAQRGRHCSRYDILSYQRFDSHLKHVNEIARKRTDCLYVPSSSVAPNCRVLLLLSEVRGRLPAFCNHTGRVLVPWRLI